MVQDVLDEDGAKAAVSKRAKQALGDMTSQNSTQSGSGRKATKRKAPGTKIGPQCVHVWPTGYTCNLDKT